MRILMIRHGDPDYVHDTGTETGWKEAQLLAKRLVKENIKDFYVSPLGRARDTAKPTLEALGVTAQEKDWLQEFPARLDITESPFLQQAFPNTRRDADGNLSRNRIVWDMMPASWMNDPAYYTPDGWRQLPIAQHSDENEVYDRVTAGLDELLASYGYVRDGHLYRTEQGHHDTIAFFCHFGVMAVMLSHLWGVSPHVLQHLLCVLPTGVTEIYTEERMKGIAAFRTCRVGDLSHLYAGGQKPSFAARFREVYEDDDRNEDDD